MHAFNFSIPGIPVIYYGDEIGLPGAGDPDSRRMMRFDNLTDEEAMLRTTVERIADLRANSMALLYGETEWEQVTEKSMVIRRTYLDQQSITVFNKSDEPLRIEIQVDDYFDVDRFDANFNGSLERTEARLILTLPPHSFDIIMNH